MNDNKKSESTSYAQKVIYLKHGVKQGNLQQNAKRCGAKAKSTGLPCKGMANKNKARCRFHGGLSTGAKTKEGKEKSRKASWRHGMYSKEAIIQRKALKLEFLRVKTENEELFRQLKKNVN